MKQIKIKRKRGIDLLWITRFIKSYGVMVGVLLVICLCTRGVLFTSNHFLFFSICAIPLSMLLLYCIEKLGSGLGNTLCGWSSRKAMLRETFAADLQKARYSKGQGHFDEALRLVNVVLKRDPNFPEALYLKAKILLDGFGNNAAAQRYLKKVMQVVPNDETLHRWASNYYDELTVVEKRWQTHLPPNQKQTRFL